MTPHRRRRAKALKQLLKRNGFAKSSSENNAEYGQRISVAFGDLITILLEEEKNDRVNSTG